eukprot:1137199_1
MYKDKPIGIWQPLLRNRVALTLFCVTVICLFYVVIRTDYMFTTNVSHSGDDYALDIDLTPLIDDIPEEYREKCRNILEGQKNMNPRDMWTKSFVDWYVYHNFFRDELFHFASQSDFEQKRQRKQTFGVYLDLGGLAPMTRTTTAFFDLCLGWAGMCIWSPDAVVDFFSGSDRSCNTISSECLWSPRSEQAFGHNDGSHCSMGTDRYIEDVLMEYVFKDRFGNDYELKEEQFEIDFVSLRIDGHEADFLRCWPFDRIAVKVFAICTVDSEMKRIQLDDVMLPNGYFKFESLSFEHSKPWLIYVQREANEPWTQDTKHHFKGKTECTMVRPRKEGIPGIPKPKHRKRP